LIGIVILGAGWPRGAPFDPLLVGRWEWSPDPEAGSPLQLKRNGSASVMVSVGCLSFPQSCRWAVEGNELKLYPAPQLDALTLDAARKYLGDCWSSRLTTPEPMRRYQILERTGDRLCLQCLESDGSAGDAAIEVYRRVVE
jgi:hypothetical protein